MSDPDEKVAAAYRSLGREEPSGALDAAILAASRRAVTPARRKRDWGVPVSIAALLMLSAGLTLHMQKEQPGIELQEPGARNAAPAAPAPPPSLPNEFSGAGSAPNEELSKDAAAPQAPKQKADAPVLQKLARPASPEPPVAAKSISPAPAPAAAPIPFPDANVARKDASRVERRQALPATEAPASPPPPALSGVTATTNAVRTEPPPGAPPAPRAFAKEGAAAEAPTPAQAPAAAPARASAAPAGAAPSAAPLASGAVGPAEKVSPMMAPQAKREAGVGVAADSAAREAQPVDELQRELERIAKLRADGRDVEADKALEEFRRKHPDYRIAAPMWERVKPRQ